MPYSGIAFVGRPLNPQDAVQEIRHPFQLETTTMCIETLTRNAGFVLAALATAAVLGLAVDRLPALSALVL
jgi:hypothetical protein